MSDDVISIEESCSCGATFNWRGCTSYAKSMASEWRSEHRHEAGERRFSEEQVAACMSVAMEVERNAFKNEG